MTSNALYALFNGSNLHRRAWSASMHGARKADRAGLHSVNRALALQAARDLEIAKLYDRKIKG